MNRENSKNHEKIKRPMPIRIMAILMALVMMLSVVYINNTWGIVRADSEGEGETTTLKVEGYINGFTNGNLEELGDYNIYVPSKKSGLEIKFPLSDLSTAALPSPDTEVHPAEGEEDLYVYKYIQDGGEGVRYYTQKVNVEGYTFDCPLKARKTITYTGFGWEDDKTMLSISADADYDTTDTAKLILRGTVSYELFIEDENNYESIVVEDAQTYVKECGKFTIHKINPENVTASVSGNPGIVSVSDSDSAKYQNESSHSYLYGNIEYYVDTTPLDISGLKSELQNKYNGLSENESIDVSIRKRVYGYDDVEMCSFICPNIALKKNEKVVDSFSLKQEIDPDDQSKDKTATGDLVTKTLTLTAADPQKPITVNIATDVPLPVEGDVENESGVTVTPKTVDDYTATAIAAESVICDGTTTQSFTIPAPEGTDHLGKTAAYDVTVSDGDISDKFTVSVTYISSEPEITEQKVATTDEYIDGESGVHYFSGNSIDLSATGAVATGSGASVNNFTLYSAKDSEDYPENGEEIALDTAEVGQESVTKTTTVTPEANVITKYKFGVTSTYNQSAVASTDLKVCYDNQAPIIQSVQIKQGSDDNQIKVLYDHDTVNNYTNFLIPQKISKRSDATITLGTDDDIDTSKIGSGIKSVEYKKSSDESYTSLTYFDNTSNASFDITGITDKNDSNYNNFDPEKYDFIVTDNLGHKTKFSVTVQFFDESISIERKLVDASDENHDTYDKSATEPYLVWNESEKSSTTGRKFYVQYTVKTKEEVKLSPTNSFKYTIDGNTTSGSATIPNPTPVEGYNVYTIKSPEIDGSASAKIDNINLSISTEYGTPAEDTMTLLYVDSDMPTGSAVEKETSATLTTGWYKADLVLAITPSETGTIQSGVKTIRAGQNNVGAVTEESGVYYATVKPSTTTEGTQFSYIVVDNAGNENEIPLTLYVDGIAPTTGLSISGVTNYNDGKIAHLKAKPQDIMISFAPDDTLSGYDDTRTVAKLTVNGTSYPIDATETSLQSYLDANSITITDTTTINISVTVYDKVGNEKTDSKDIVVDSKDPVPTAWISDGSGKNAPYYKTDVEVSFKITDDNLYEDGSNIEVFDDNNPVSGVSFSVSGNTATGKMTLAKTMEGPHKITVKATDKSGRSKTSDVVSFYIDSTVPNLTAFLDGEEYSAQAVNSSYNNSAKTELKIDDSYPNANDINVKITRNIPGGSSVEEDKTGAGPFTLTEDGGYTVKYMVYDLAGNYSEKTIGFTVDNSKPVHNMYITTADPAKVAKYNNTYSNAVGKFSGHSDQEEYTYGQYYNTDVSIDFSFFDYNIKSAQVTDNGSVLPVNWSFNGPYGKGSYTISSEGYHEIVISSTDKSDNTTTDSGANQKLRFTIDKSAPTISTSLNGVRYSEGSGVRYFNTNGTIDVSVSDANIDGSDLNRINRMTVPGSSVSVSEASVGEGAETFSTEADYEVQYYAIDRAGNRSDTRTVMFRVDKTAPQLQVSNVGAVSTAGSQNVSFNVKEAFFSDMNNVTIKIYKRVEGRAEVLEKTIDFKPNSANDSTSYTFSEDAEYRIEFTAEDKCGNKSNTDYSFIKDGTAPLITLSGVSNYDKTDKNVELTVIIDEAFYSSNRVTLSGTRTDINGKSNAITFDSFVTNRSKISQLQQLFKEDGIYDITVTSTDKAGNSSSKGVHFTIDTTDPVIGDLSKYDGIRTNSFKWDTNLDELVTDLTVCDIKVYMDGSLYDGTSDVEDGSHVLKIEATDELGHTTTKEVTFVLDSRGPNIIISNVEDGDNLLDSTEVIVTVELDEDSLDTVMLNDKAVEVKDNQAKLTVNKKGKYTLSATAHDEAGNASSAEIKFTFGKQTNLLLIGIIAGILILLLLALLVVIKRRQKDQ